MSHCSTAYEWVRRVAPDSLTFDEVPLLGHAPSFPWDEFAKHMQNSLDLTEVKISADAWQWRELEDLNKDFPEKQHLYSFSVSGFEGEAHLSIAKSDLEQIEALILKVQPSTLKEIDKAYIEGFRIFLALHMHQMIGQCDFDKSLSFQLLADSKLPKTTSLCREITIKVNDKTIKAHLLYSPVFVRACGKKYRESEEEQFSRKELAQKLAFDCSLMAGFVDLSQQEFDSLKEGDILLLDRSIINEEYKGRVVGTVRQHEIFQAQIKPGKIRISATAYDKGEEKEEESDLEEEKV